MKLIDINKLSNKDLKKLEKELGQEIAKELTFAAERLNSNLIKYGLAIRLGYSLVPAEKLLEDNNLLKERTE